MKVEELVIDGFKSYSVRTVITNWDSQFNAITGLNGSGKSNILDAICFVLGITNTSALRAQNLQDLIYKKGQSGVTKASVTITFDNSDKKCSPVAYKDDPKIIITRKISVDSPVSTSTKYFINGRKATQKEIANLLQSVQLNINNPNFLIMQGKITKMLNMKPIQVLNLIEEASGTKSYEAQRDASQKIIEKKDLKLDSIRTTLSDQVEPKLAELQKQTEVVVEYRNKANEKDQYTQIFESYRYQLNKETFDEINNPLQEEIEKLKNLENTSKNYEQQIKNLVDDINKIKSRNQNSDSAILKNLEDEEQKLSNDITRLKISQKLKLENINELKQSIESKYKEMELTQSKTEIQKKNFEKVQSDFLMEEENLKSYKELLHKKEDILSTLSTGISSKGGTDAGYSSQLREANKRLSETKTSIEQSKLRIRHLQKDIDINKLEEHKRKIIEYEKEISKRIKNCENIEDQLRKSGFDGIEYEKLKQEENDLLQQLNIKNRYLQDFTRQDSRFDFTYEKPTSDFNSNSVKGLCGELFGLPPNNQRTATALEVCAGYKLFNVVVDTERTGSLLLEKGRLRKRVTIVPLNKITSKVVRSDILQEAKRQAPNKVELALNLVEYDDSVKKAIEFVFGNKLICDDPETAKKVTFNDRIRTGSITLEGDNYDPEGRLSGGSRRASSSLIAKFAKYKELREEVVNIRNRLDKISRVLRNMNHVAEQNRDIQQKLATERYQIDILNKKLNESTSARYIENFKKVTEQIEDLNKTIELNENKIVNIEKEIAEINKDMNEFNSDGSKKLRELKIEITSMTEELKKREKSIAKSKANFNEQKIKNDDVYDDIQNLKISISNNEQEIPNIEQSIKDDDLIIHEHQLKLDAITEKIEIEKERTAGFIEELNQMSSHLQNTRNKLVSNKNEIESCKEKVTSLKNLQRHAAAEIKEAVGVYPWVENDTQRMRIIENNPDYDLDFCEQKIDECEARLAELKAKGADANIIQQAEMLKNHAFSLEAKIKKIEKDKVKIQSTIEKLDEYLQTELNKTFEKVSHDFGETFALLLPNSYAKLVKIDPKGDISKGLEVKVQLGKVWKESLVELSGGQRSLVALALIMSLLQFKPAPMYILDEVDAALDLSHTQSIGQLIKTKFKGSQFIVVSLKEGMFTNANRLFKVRFQDGTSVVTAS
ncbi:Structural maintenance of chromosomes protein 2 [Pichia californica]|uniref:Structural maintenance of chromosomes protein n=1 Tax=Pichia californica TaxID=460514 RepID=A0A9P6WPX8_9ASCO|nr:Structural maintenance of chromosomes protein 2 [[Candida] californica]